MRTFCTLVLGLLLAVSFTAAAGAAPGDPDPSFSGDGRLTVPVSVNDDDERGNVAAVAPDGDVLVAGEVPGFPGTGIDAVVVRLNAAGGREIDWSEDGIARLAANPMSGDTDTFRALLVLPDGRVVAAGQAGGMMLVARFLADGTPDPSFGGGDGAALPFPGSAHALAVDAQGRLLVGGDHQSEAGLARLRDDGTPDESFNEDGIATDLPPGYDFGRTQGIVVQPDGRLVVSARVNAPGGIGDFLLIRFTPTGDQEGAFGLLGRTVVDFGGADEGPLGLAATPGGGFVAAGQAGEAATAEVGVVRYDAAGNLDPGFSGDGTATFKLGRFARGRGVAVQPNGRIVVSGHVARDDAGSDTDMMALRLTPAGELDPSFGAGGFSRIVFPGGSDAGALALGPDGRVVLPGTVITEPDNPLAAVVLETERADLSVSVAGTPNPAPAGGTVTFTATIANGGPYAAENVIAFAGAATCGLVTSACLGALAPGASATTAYTVQAPAAGTVSASYRVAAATPDGNPGNNLATATVPVADATAPVISKAGLTRTRFRVGPGAPSANAAAKAGASLRFTLSEAARVRLAVARKTAGRRRGRSCRKPARPPRGRRCTRLVPAKPAIVLPGRAGANAIRFTGRLSNTKKLAPGAHQLVVTATDAAGNRSKAVRLGFRIVRR